MFSDGMEEYDNCVLCKGGFPRPLTSRMSVNKWIEALGPESIAEDPWKVLATMDKQHYKEYSKDDQHAMHRGLCSNECLIKYLNQDIDILKEQLQKAKARINVLQVETKQKDMSLKAELTKTKNKLSKEQTIAIDLESARGYASSELNKIREHPYKYALSQLFPKGYRIKRFFRTNSFAEFVCKYLIVLLIGLVLYETISRI
tara:strand:+ start:278 stop:883 length:606 start_codon:yes stop_codon:yes gene_type:complete